MSEELVSDDTYIKLYDKIADLFPLHAYAMLNISVRNVFWEPARRNDNTLASKKKAIVMYFFALCRARNKDHMIHWAMVETLALFGKGISQSTTRSDAGKNFTCKLERALQKVDAIYNKCQPAVKDALRLEPTISFVLDNYQNKINKRIQTGGRSSIVHKATASSVMRNKVPTLPFGTTIQSPSNNMYKVSNTKRESPYLLILEIVLASPTSEALPLDEQLYLTVGLIWPNAGMKWKI